MDMNTFRRNNGPDCQTKGRIAEVWKMNYKSNVADRYKIEWYQDQAAWFGK